MGIEIERKFLVKSDGWRKLGCAVRYAQGYLCSDRNRTVRVRTVGDKGFLTVKGRGSGIAHPEYEYEIPYNEARTILHRRKLYFRGQLSGTWKTLKKGKGF